MPLKVFFFDPARVFVSVPSSCPSPQTREDSVIHAGGNFSNLDIAQQEAGPSDKNCGVKECAG